MIPQVVFRVVTWIITVIIGAVRALCENAPSLIPEQEKFSICHPPPPCPPPPRGGPVHSPRLTLDPHHTQPTESISRVLCVHISMVRVGVTVTVSDGTRLHMRPERVRWCLRRVLYLPHGHQHLYLTLGMPPRTPEQL